MIHECRYTYTIEANSIKGDVNLFVFDSSMPALCLAKILTGGVL